MLRSSEHTRRLLLPCVPSSRGRARLWQSSEPGDSRLWHCLLLQALLQSCARLAERRGDLGRGGRETTLGRDAQPALLGLQALPQLSHDCSRTFWWFLAFCGCSPWGWWEQKCSPGPGQSLVLTEIPGQTDGSCCPSTPLPKPQKTRGVSASCSPPQPGDSHTDVCQLC